MGTGAIFGAVTGGLAGAWGAGVKGLTWLEMLGNDTSVLWEFGRRLALGTALPGKVYGLNGKARQRSFTVVI
jgi:hypothetical protein